MILLLCFYSKNLGAGKMAHCIKILVAKPDNQIFPQGLNNRKRELTAAGCPLTT